MFHAPTSENKSQSDAGRSHREAQGREHAPQAAPRVPSRSASAIQTKLALNNPGDRFEQEADRAADRVMRMTAAPTGETALPGKCAKCEDEEKKTELHRKETNAGPRVAPPSVHDVLKSPGRPLDPGTRSEEH